MWQWNKQWELLVCQHSHHYWMWLYWQHYKKTSIYQSTLTTDMSCHFKLRAGWYVWYFNFNYIIVICCHFWCLFIFIPFAFEKLHFGLPSCPTSHVRLVCPFPNKFCKGGRSIKVGNKTKSKCFWKKQPRALNSNFRIWCDASTKGTVWNILFTPHLRWK